MNIFAYFQSKVALLAEVNRLRTERDKQYMRADGLDDQNDDLRRQNRNLEHAVEYKDRQIADLCTQVDREKATAALEKETILRTVAGIGPALLERMKQA